MKVQVFEGCCQPVTAGVLGESDAEDLAAAFKVLADPARFEQVLGQLLGNAMKFSGPGKVIEEFDSGLVTIELSYFKERQPDTARTVRWQIRVD